MSGGRGCRRISVHLGVASVEQGYILRSGSGEDQITLDNAGTAAGAVGTLTEAAFHVGTGAARPGATG